jgi:xanthine phosphoribosyltransferase
MFFSILSYFMCFNIVSNQSTTHSLISHERTTMQALKDKILTEGIVLSNHILKVDSFLNHQLDVIFLSEVALELTSLFNHQPITKILTAEASGIAIATLVGLHLKVPIVYAKKFESLTLDDDVFKVPVYSYTKQKQYQLRVSKPFLTQEDHVLIIDDFLANGESLKALWELVKLSHAQCVGAGVVIEKSFQNGSTTLINQGLNVKALVSISSMEDGKITFK